MMRILPPIVPNKQSLCLVLANYHTFYKAARPRCTIRRILG